MIRECWIETAINESMGSIEFAIACKMLGFFLSVDFRRPKPRASVVSGSVPNQRKALSEKELKVHHFKPQKFYERSCALSSITKLKPKTQIKCKTY